MREKLKRKNGITLIALVVTIVVLLILAGVSISMLLGENGIITQAQNSKEESEIGKEKEMVSLAVSSLKGQGYVNGKNMLTSENLQKEMDNLAGKDKTLVTGTTILTVLFKETNREYTVNAEGEFADGVDYSNIYTYTEDGYITGLKSEYITNRPPELISKRYASTKKIRVSDIQYRWLVEELNGILKIPNRIKDIDIIGIASNAFFGIGNLKLVIIDDGIKIIENRSFYACIRLTKIKLPNTISKIEEKAFASCNDLDSIIIPESIQEIGENTFNNSYMETIIIAKEEQLENEPWGADDTSVNYINSDLINKYFSNKTEGDLEKNFLLGIEFGGTIDEFFEEFETTKEQAISKLNKFNITYLEFLKLMQEPKWIVKEYELGILDKNAE